jgi:hypothetical protein
MRNLLNLYKVIFGLSREEFGSASNSLDGCPIKRPVAVRSNTLGVRAAISRTHDERSFPYAPLGLKFQRV